MSQPSRNVGQRPSHHSRQRVTRNRRCFLQALGASAAALPFYRLLESSAVHAQEEDSPLSFIGVYHPHGVASPLFRRRAEDTEDVFDLTFTEPQSGAQCVLAPFDDAATYGRSFKDKIVVLDGLDIVTGLSGHDAPPSIFTGAGHGAKAPSLDQYLAVDQGLGSDTPFSSLALGVGTLGDEKETLVMSSAGAALPRLIDPAETFATVFGNLADPADMQMEEALRAQRERDQSVIDYAKADIDRLKGRLAPPEAAKLDQHLTSLREIEKQLAGFDGMCTPPGAPPTFDKVRRYNGGEVNFEQITNLQIDMLAQAIGCGLTRFGTLWMGDLSAGATEGTSVSHPAYGPNVDVHNTIAHQYFGPRGDMPGTPESWANSGVQQRYSYGKCARLLQQLESAGALDNTLVMVSTDMGDSNRHSSEDVPMVLAGGAGGKLAMGRHIRLKDNCPPDNIYCQPPAVVPHNRLLVSIANLFGVETAAFGSTSDPSHASGALSELSA